MFAIARYTKKRKRNRSQLWGIPAIGNTDSTAISIATGVNTLDLEI
jgi:hypothetical protein